MKKIYRRKILLPFLLLFGMLLFLAISNMKQVENVLLITIMLVGAGLAGLILLFAGVLSYVKVNDKYIEVVNYGLNIKRVDILEIKELKLTSTSFFPFGEQKKLLFLKSNKQVALQINLNAQKSDNMKEILNTIQSKNRNVVLDESFKSYLKN